MMEAKLWKNYNYVPAESRHSGKTVENNCNKIIKFMKNVGFKKKVWWTEHHMMLVWNWYNGVWKNKVSS